MHASSADAASRQLRQRRDARSGGGGRQGQPIPPVCVLWQLNLARQVSDQPPEALPLTAAAARHPNSAMGSASRRLGVLHDHLTAARIATDVAGDRSGAGLALEPCRAAAAAAAEAPVLIGGMVMDLQARRLLLLIC